MMTFPNGYSGVKKLFIAEILGLIASVLLIITGAGAITAIGSAGTNDAVANVALAGTGLFGLATSVLMVIGYILKLVGLNQASKDEEYFKLAFRISIAVLLISVISGVLSAIIGTNGVVDDIVALIQRIGDVVVIFFVIFGIQRFAEKLNYEKLVQRGKTISWVIAAPYIISGIMKLIPAFFTSGGVGTTIGGVLIIISGVLGIVGSILYLIYLGQGRNMLKNN